jgi:hypothetical protein
VSHTEQAPRRPRAEPTLDLERPAGDPWDEVEVPEGWREVARVARAVAADLDGLADHIVGCVQAEVEAYVPGPVPVEDLRASVTRTSEMLLIGIAEHRGPTDEEIAIRRDLGVRRAHQGLAIDAVIRAYHVGYREIWLALVRAVDEDDERASAQLLEAATTVWGWIHAVTDAVTTAHAQTTRQLEARVIGARQRLVELLAGGEPDGLEATTLARSLGFDPDGSFTVTVLQGATDDRDAVELQRLVGRLGGTDAVVARGPLVVVVSQGHDPEALTTTAREVVPLAAVAVGLERTGLRGAAESLVDAQLTLAVTLAGGTETFDRTWLWATLADADERLRTVLAPGVAVATKHPHLAEAVQAFGAAHNFSVSEAARHLEVHANTVGYRLDRWAELTGWDPRTFPGLARSLAALRAR